MEPIRQVFDDGRKERIVQQWLEKKMPWRLFPTPRFYFTDFHINRLQDNGRENYIGDIEIKWLNIDSTYPAIFPFNKLQQLLIAPPYTDGSEVYHRIMLRYTNGTAIIPVKELARLIPVVHTRKDTNETDMVVKISMTDFGRYFKFDVIEEA